ncbi:MAG: hypothetical protein IPG17_30560 [Sandaracinaceae bacterium]|nr:hypothetical protein [Sandaracinaceae bacterium]
MLKIVPDPEAPAKPPVSRRLHDAFRAEMDALPDVTDFASLERAALELANRVVHAHMTRALEALVKEHGTEDVLVDGERYRFHAWGTGRYPSLVGTWRWCVRRFGRWVYATGRRWFRWSSPPRS